MRQEVNLYLSEFKPKVILLSANHAMFLLLASLLLMVFYSFFEYKKLLNLKEENSSLAIYENKNSASDASDNLMEKIRARREYIENEIKALSENIKNKESIKIAVENNVNKNKVSFFNIFSSVGNLANEKISISTIEIYSGGEEIVIDGLSVNKESVPSYLDDLKNDKSFADTQFGLLNIKKMEDSPFYNFGMSRRKKDG
ncbi:MAG: hypothetical protein ACRBCI_13180 [Cellvibrionaceae bacterium]